MKVISEKLGNRGLSEVQTDKFFDLFFKMYRLLEKEAVESEYRRDREIEEKKACFVWS